MADGPFPTVRPEVRQYLKACENLMAGTDGVHTQFLDASTALQLKSGIYTDEELALVRNILCRVSETLGNDHRR